MHSEFSQIYSLHGELDCNTFKVVLLIMREEYEVNNYVERAEIVSNTCSH